MQVQAGSSTSASPARRLSVLIADDEPMILNALRLLLERRGHEVHAAADAYQALDLLGQHTFDAVIVDAHMPGHGGTVLQHLHETGFSGLQVLMTGGIAADAMSEYEGVRRLQKPFSFPAVIPLLESNVSN